MKGKLTAKQEMFCKEYLIDLNATRAAKAVGYSEKTANDGYYVYLLINPISNKVFYVGKGKGNRVTRHAKDARLNKGNSLNVEEIKHILKNKSTPIEFILENNLIEEDAYFIERKLIESFKKTGINNIVNGTVTSKEKVQSSARNLLARVKPFDMWVNDLNDSLIKTINNVFGSKEKCYYSIVNDIKGMLNG